MNVRMGTISAVRFPYCRLFGFPFSKTLISSCRWRHTSRNRSKSIRKIVSPSALASISTTAVTGSASPVAAAVEKPKPWLIVGLGNPGKKYAGTRHNVGFEMVDAIAEGEGISMGSVSFKALFGKGFIGNVPVMLAKPQTFMNASGWSNCFILQDSAEASTCDI